jgi:hypothetical protein
VPDVLSQRDLNRALLARQSLLERQATTAYDAIERVAGVQSQLPAPPFIGLWNRVTGFDESELQRLIDERQIVRATMMRHTIHFVSARDYVWLRPTIQAALDKNYSGVTGKRLAGFDIEPFLKLARRELRKRPLTFAQIQQLIVQRDPECDVRAIAYAVRTFVPLIGVPNESRWRFGGRAPFTLAEDGLGEPLAAEDPQQMVRRYLTAFGPATPGDATAWSGVGGMRTVFDDLRDELRVFHDESGRELFDVEDGLLPGGDCEAPVRLLPQFDNTLLSHKDRTRVIADEHRPLVNLLPGGLLGTLLLDGFAAASWRIERKRDAATLTIEPFRRITKIERKLIEPEAEALMAFAEPDAETYAIQ